MLWCRIGHCRARSDVTRRRPSSRLQRHLALSEPLFHVLHHHIHIKHIFLHVFHSGTRQILVYSSLQFLLLILLIKIVRSVDHGCSDQSRGDGWRDIIHGYGSCVCDGLIRRSNTLHCWVGGWVVHSNGCRWTVIHSCLFLLV